MSIVNRTATSALFTMEDTEVMPSLFAIACVNLEDSVTRAEFIVSNKK